MKRTRVAALVGLTGLALAVGACGNSSSSPTTPTVTLGQPTLVSPAAFATISASAQPITLTVSNVSGASASATYTFEVASDVAFANKVSTKTATAGSSGQTSVQADTLNANTVYYWHAKVTDGSNSGSFSAAAQFTVGAAVSISAPVPVSPANGATTGGWPTMTVTNSARSGPTGAIVYKFEISTSSSFSTIAFSAIVNEGVGQTSFLPSANQVATIGTTYYWRVTATDSTNNVSSAASTARSFTYSTLAQGMAAQQGLVLWPGVQPPVANFGNAKIGAGWSLYTATSWDGSTQVTSPTLEIIRTLDLIDRGMSAPAAVDWLRANYGTTGLYYSNVFENGKNIPVIGFIWHYMAQNSLDGVPGSWELVFRAGA